MHATTFINAQLAFYAVLSPLTICTLGHSRAAVPVFGMEVL